MNEAKPNKESHNLEATAVVDKKDKTVFHANKTNTDLDLNKAKPNHESHNLEATVVDLPRSAARSALQPALIDFTMTQPSRRLTRNTHYKFLLQHRGCLSLKTL